MPSRITWTLAAWEDYQYWQGQDRKTLKRINALIQDCLREPFDGIGKPEPLKENLSGFWSRRIDETHRLVYRVDGDDLVGRAQKSSATLPERLRCCDGKTLRTVEA